MAGGEYRLRPSLFDYLRRGIRGHGFAEPHHREVPEDYRGASVTHIRAASTLPPSKDPPAT